MAEFASKGVANAGLTTGIIGTAGWLLNGGLGNVLGGGAMCSENQMVNRYELSLHQELAAKDSRIGLLEADKYTDQKLADFADRVSDRFRNVEAQIAAQAVTNAQMHAAEPERAERADQDHCPHRQCVPAAHAPVQQLDRSHHDHHSGGVTGRTRSRGLMPPAI